MLNWLGALIITFLLIWLGKRVIERRTKSLHDNASKIAEDFAKD
jgi:membrane protein implicated in regulation of membrane protease activity